VAATDTIHRLLRRADEVRKAAPARTDPGPARERIAELLDHARAHLDDVSDDERRRELAARITRRVADLEQDEVEAMLEPSPGVGRAPTVVDEPTRVPPGQHLTAGFPVLHVGRAPEWGWGDVRLVVTGRVRRRLVLAGEDLDGFERHEVRRDFHCVTTWTRLDNAWTGVRVRDVVDAAGARADATHAVVAGHPAYTANLPLEHLLADDALLAWAHDGRPLTRDHGGPLRLVVPALYGWKSVKWVTEIRLLERDVPGYWEERGYHDLGDPWREQRFRDGGEPLT
jgi:DMSO/TMAO reductase YedYZ molybdopterin-dependent catalytic subunit